MERRQEAGWLRGLELQLSTPSANLPPRYPFLDLSSSPCTPPLLRPRSLGTSLGRAVLALLSFLSLHIHVYNHRRWHKRRHRVSLYLKSEYRNKSTEKNSFTVIILICQPASLRSTTVRPPRRPFVCTPEGNQYLKRSVPVLLFLGYLSFEWLKWFAQLFEGLEEESRLTCNFQH